jgi:bifunctional non-homologous end joining protein LigD
MPVQPLQQIAPQVARGKFDESLWANQNYVAQEKLDGERFKMHFFENENRFDSRSISKKTDRFTEKTDNVPHLRDFVVPSLNGTVLDGEIKFGGDSMSTSTIMGCLADEAVNRQREAGKWVKYYVFDIIFFKGKDVRDLSFIKRMEILHKIFNDYLACSTNFILPVYTYDHKKQFCDDVWAHGGEGVILKDVRAPYTDKKAWVKVKAQATYDVVVMGYEEPEAESIKKGDDKATITRLAANGWIGTVVFGQYNNGELQCFGKCSGMNDADREKFSRNREKMLGTVIKIEAQSRIPKTGYFRHPRYLGIREDKNADQCLFYEGEK